MKAPKWSKLIDSVDAGGRRWFLDGRPVHAGACLCLRMPSNAGAQRAAEVAQNAGLHDVACRLRTPIAYVRFEQRRGEPSLWMSSGRDPYIYDEDDHMTSTWPGNPAAYWTGAQLLVSQDGFGWERYDFCWPDQLPWSER